MLELRPMEAAELHKVLELERDADTVPYILPASREQHESAMARDDMVYLTISRDDRFAGFFILLLEADGESVELRRIVVGEKGAGIGREAILRLEAYCRDRLDRGRIWLDVFDFNERGRHLYSSVGYRYTGEQEIDGKRLLLFEKLLR